MIRSQAMIRRSHLVGLKMELVQMVPVGIRRLHGPRANTIPVFCILFISEADEENGFLRPGHTFPSDYGTRYSLFKVIGYQILETSPEPLKDLQICLTVPCN